MAAVLAVAIATRFSALDTAFQNGHDAAVALDVLKSPGYLWMLDRFYGAVVPFVVKVCLAASVATGIAIDEFAFRAPIAVLGWVHLPITYLFVRRLGFSNKLAFGTTLLVSLAPIHIAHSRYPYGHEIAGLLCLTLAVWSLVRFFERPTWDHAFLATCASLLYLISHHYIMPFFACVPALPLLVPSSDTESVVRRIRLGMVALLTRGIWLAPVLAFPMIRGAFAHAGQRDTTLGFYFDTHAVLFAQEVGYALAFGLVAAVILGLVRRQGRRVVAALTYCAGAYFAPLVFGAPTHVTIVYSYFLIGSYFLILAAAASLESLLAARPRMTKAFVSVVLLGTVLADVRLLNLNGSIGNAVAMSTHAIQRAADDNGMQSTARWIRDNVGPIADMDFTRWTGMQARIGAVTPDRGMKTAAYLIRTHQPNASVVVLYPFGDAGVCDYYFERPVVARTHDVRMANGGFDVFAEQLRNADIVLIGHEEIDPLEKLGRFERKTVIHSGTGPKLWVYGRPRVAFPVADDVHVDTYNPLFDESFAPCPRNWTCKENHPPTRPS